MADSKISALSAVTTVADTDEYVVARSGATNKITGANLKAAVGGADGWIPDSATWAYASATTFTIAGVDVTAKFSKGTRIKLTQSATVKYFVVASSSFSTDTTVTITGGSDYTFTNNAVTLNYYSYQANPQGFPGWFTYDCGPTGFSGTPTQRTSRFRVDGNMCTAYVDITGTSNTTAFTFNAPMNYARSYWTFAGQGTNNAANPTSPYLVAARAAPTNVVDVYTNYQAAAFTASGTKQVQVTIMFEF